MLLSESPLCFNSALCCSSIACRLCRTCQLTMMVRHCTENARHHFRKHPHAMSLGEHVQRSKVVECGAHALNHVLAQHLRLVLHVGQDGAHACAKQAPPVQHTSHRNVAEVRALCQSRFRTRRLTPHQSPSQPWTQNRACAQPHRMPVVDPPYITRQGDSLGHTSKEACGPNPHRPHAALRRA